MDLPHLPEACVVQGRLAVFIDGQCKLMELDAAESFVRTLQGQLAKLRQHEKKRRREVRKALEKKHAFS